MFKKILMLMLTLFAASAFAAVDVNKASQAELETIKGIGPGISAKILEERNKGAFKDWPDMVERVKGVGEHNAAKFSTEGMTVNGVSYAGAPAKPAAESAKAGSKASAKAQAKPVPAAVPAPMATAPKAAAPAASAPMTAAEKKAAAKQAKEDKKAAKAAAAEDAKKAKAEKKAAAAAAAASAGKK
ncbi:ComEA family DNA-binding protein [Roseateles koreensis]|uniref:Helix-hairpin-helix domain-containing protein n=1 Tax=Roseateles koreensis TaxID=2987526 RepID=A0ABT5KPE5_9BURK|nr:helix-hairpin-helix domain-containing protein [Roseateles koreensis]MDC8784726.1 helix-hairpin-helix domain-containing protein [Roseateles koreensis]